MDHASWAVMRQRDFGLLWWGGLISFLGDWMLRVALPVTVLGLTGSAAALAATTAAAFLPALVIGPLVGVFVDRWDRKRVMVTANLAQAAVLLPLLSVDSKDTVWIIMIVAFAQSTIAPFNRIAENALLPRLVAAEHLPAANSLNAVNDNLARFIGPVVGVSVAAWSGLLGVTLVDAGTYLVAAAMVALVHGRHRAEQGPGVSGRGALSRLFHDMWDGLRVVRRSRLLLIVFTMLAVFNLGNGVMATMFVVFAEQEFSNGPQAFGWLVAAQAIGGVVGGLTGGRLAARFSPRLLLGFGLIFFGLCDLTTFNYPQWYPHVGPGLLIMIVVGVPSTVSSAAFMTLKQTAVTDGFRGRVLALGGSLNAACMIAGTGVAALTAGHFDVVTVLSVQALTPILAGAIALLLLGPNVIDQSTFVRPKVLA